MSLWSWRPASEGARSPDAAGDFAESAPHPSETFIVGVGASAGGLEALERMFDHIPPDTGMAFVVVQHLSPDFKSVMDELLARHTRMPIYRVKEGMRVEPNCIYLIPPKKEMIISEGRLHLTDKDPAQALTLPIDHFFRSLAQDAGGRSIAVVLSGTGSDGSRGIRDVHEAGGLVIAQSEQSARFDGMPRSALETGIVDISVDPNQIGEVLVRYAQHPLRSQWKAAEDHPVDESALARIFRLLQQRHHVDFNYYKPTTIGRRIERRIQLNHNGSLEDYVRRLETDPDEVDRLYKDLLIGVTRFFRDRDAFEALANEVLPPLLVKAPADEEFRVWVAGCATGEEAYSLAMLIHDHLENMQRAVDVKIFATDLHRASLERASTGIYHEAELENVSDARRQRYFHRVESGYQVRSEIRRMIVFAPHNLTKDAPFTRMQLITCRNLLIYLRPHAQKKVLSLFHFGLNAGGILFLGSSETPGDLADEFEAVHERWRIYRKRRDVRLPADTWGPLSLLSPPPQLREGTLAAGRTLVVPDSEMVAVYDELLAQFMPPAVLVNERWEVLQSFSGAGKFLQFRDGRLTVNLLDLALGDLKLALTGALQRAAKNEESITYSRVRVVVDGEEQFVRLTVSPIRQRGLDAKYLVTFQHQQTPPAVAAAADEPFDAAQITQERVHDLEQELRYTKENLQATIEELETSNEELQASNEELVASNEELQSTNEELHSVNEELYTVNAEYQKKIHELTELTSDMDNLLAGTEVHTLFLDANLCVRKFTPKLADVFNLLPQDVGRRIDAFTHNIQCDGVAAKLRRVLETGKRYEETVDGPHGNRYLMRVLPYQASHRTKGVVLTLIDISSLAKAQEQVRQGIERRDRFLAMLSHELRNPMGAVLNALELVSGDFNGDPLHREALEVIDRQTRHMACLLDDLLDVSRITQNKITYRRQVVNLEETAEDAAQTVQHLVDAKSQRFSMDVSGAPLRVWGDAARLKQVLVNLLTNASKYTPQGGRIELELTRDGGTAVACVRDSGEGIPPDLLESLFDVFVQSDVSLDRAGGGMGLGLAISRTIVEAHRGTITAHSEGLGLGSQFTIRLPLTDKEPPLRSSAKNWPNQQGRRLLLAEDNPDARRMLAKILQKHGFEVLEAGSGPEAVELYQSATPPVAVIDIGLPQMDGHEVARAIRRHPQGASALLIALTGYGRKSDREATQAAGFDGHLVKPLDPDDLFALLAEKMGKLIQA